MKERGRWITDASVHRYKKACLAQGELAKLSAEQKVAARTLSQDPNRMLVDRAFLHSTMAKVLAGK